MAKSSNFFKAVLGIGAATAAVLLSRKESRDRLKQEYDKYKENPESYKENAKELANQVASKATETFNEVKQDPKGFINEQKERFKGESEDEEHVEEARFTDEGAADPSNNLRVVTEDELKNNKNK